MPVDGNGLAADLCRGGEASQSTVSAMSSAVTQVRIEVPAAYWRRIASGSLPLAAASLSITRSIRGPSTAPGQMAFTRMPAGPSSIASVFIKPMTPHFAAA